MTGLNTPKGLPTLKPQKQKKSIKDYVSQYPEGPTYFKT